MNEANGHTHEHKEGEHEAHMLPHAAQEYVDWCEGHAVPVGLINDPPDSPPEPLEVYFHGHAMDHASWFLMGDLSHDHWVLYLGDDEDGDVIAEWYDYEGKQTGCLVAAGFAMGTMFAFNEGLEDDDDEDETEDPTTKGNNGS